MPQEGNQLLGFHERLTALEKKAEKSEEKHQALEKKVDKHDSRIEWNEREVKGIKSDIKEIRDDTKWLRRTFTAAIITTVSTGVIGGAIALIYSLIGGG